MSASQIYDQCDVCLYPRNKSLTVEVGHRQWLVISPNHIYKRDVSESLSLVAYPSSLFSYSNPHLFPIMTGTCDTVDIVLARDNAAKKFSWCILPGRSMASARSESSFTPQTRMLPKPADTSTEDRSAKHSAIWHLRGFTMTRPTLNQHLESYFHRMQQTAPRICHPLTIHNEARLIIHTVNNAGFAGQPKLLGEAVAKALFIAGAAQLQYTRTVALLTHDVLVELNLSNWCAMRAMQIYLENIATSTILNAWYNFSVDLMFTPNATGLEKAGDILEALRDEKFNAAALYGDLAALGIIPCGLLIFVINCFLDHLSSVTQFRMLYLLVIRATFRIESSIHPDCLLGWREKLLFPKRMTMPMGNKMVQRWIIVSDRTFGLLGTFG
ncbi:hypothetical protein DEU56DRAFT_783500 [Suillus clintonianus]|uniref:uncharacterized protein n=1 Tax=Suillus clintonianus TaxID=1904413 RepID=UPI001B882D6C|nr:uncharacterized protein DEU56DRAFT_783500 [Suillus clintonianus]KAG2148005.1 hypothetical protein DEU56DRAFT_783500 [Suillus clintonianus]